MKRFDRRYAVSFGPRNGELKVITELRCRFRIEKSDKKTANVAQIELFNLSEASRNILQDEDVIILLSAGYVENEQGLFIGDVTKVEHRREGPDRVTLIEGGDGQKALNKATVSKSYAKGTKLTKVIGDVISSFENVSFSQALESVISPSAELNTAGAFEGQSDQVLSELVSSYGLSFSIQDGELILSGNPALQDTEIQVVKSSTGLINSPAKTEKGIAFQMLLEPRIRPGTIVQLESLNITGAYRVTKVVYEGDNFDLPWFISVEADAI